MEAESKPPPYLAQQGYKGKLNRREPALDQSFTEAHQDYVEVH